MQKRTRSGGICFSGQLWVVSDRTKFEKSYIFWMFLVFLGGAVSLEKGTLERGPKNHCFPPTLGRGVKPLFPGPIQKISCFFMYRTVFRNMAVVVVESQYFFKDNYC